MNDIYNLLNDKLFYDSISDGDTSKSKLLFEIDIPNNEKLIRDIDTMVNISCFGYEYGFRPPLITNKSTDSNIAVVYADLTQSDNDSRMLSQYLLQSLYMVLKLPNMPLYNTITPQIMSDVRLMDLCAKVKYIFKNCSEDDPHYNDFKNIVDDLKYITNMKYNKIK